MHNLTARFLALIFVAILTSCGGGSGTQSANPPVAEKISVSGFVVDDYVIGALVKISDAQTGVVAGQTTTGARGQFSIELPPGRNYHVEVTGGKLDGDGDPSTAGDQANFGETVRGMITVALQQKSQIFSAATTGIVAFVGTDATKYTDLVVAADATFPVLISNDAEILPRLTTVLAVQRAAGFAAMVKEFADDGMVNGSAQVSARSVQGIANASARATLLGIADPQLLACVEEALGKQSPITAEIALITDLVCTDRYIYSLDGIGSLKGLVSLILRGNAISSVAPLSTILSLEYVDVSSNRIATVEEVARAAYLVGPTFNLEDNCIAQASIPKSAEFLNLDQQRVTCDKAVRGPVLFNAQRLTAEKFIVTYRVPQAVACDLQYSSTVSTALTCDSRIHRVEVVAPWSGIDEYVRLNIGGKSYALYKIGLRIPAAVIAKFSDTFDSSTLDLAKWTVGAFNGNLATYSQANGFLNISDPGGSCGFCGVSDGARFSPRVDVLAGDFEVILSAEEVERLSRDSTRALSNVQLLLTGTAAELGIYIVGDVTSNQGAVGHQIITYYRVGSSVTYPSIRNLAVGQYYAFQFRIRRASGVSYLAYKIAQDAAWTELTVPTSFPANANLSPSIVVASGDGGGTRINSSFKVRLDAITITR